jgi:hypothetical protein
MLVSRNLGAEDHLPQILACQVSLVQLDHLGLSPVIIYQLATRAATA